MKAERSMSTTKSKLSGPRYHTLAKDSEVDSSLFATPKPKGRGFATSLVCQDSTNQKTHTGSKQQSRKGSDDLSAIVISRHELERMRGASCSPSADDIERQRMAAQQQAEAEMAKAQERTARMLELEEQRRRNEPPSESELIRRAEKDTVHAKAMASLQEQRDEVKVMSAMLAYAKCAAIRDEQLKEKTSLVQAERQRQHQLDAEQEADRVAAVALYEERNAKRVDAQRQGARVLEQQLAERQYERQRQEESLLQEGVRLAHKLAQLEEEDRKAAAFKLEAARDLMSSVVAGNATLAAQKKQAELMEAAQDARILEYQLQRDRREQEALEAKEQAEKVKDMQMAKLWASQQRLADRQSQVDELRARRWQDAAERDARVKEAARREQQALIAADLADARAAQGAQRVQARAVQAKIQAEEHARIQAEVQAVAFQHLQMEETAVAERKEHANQLREQIAAHEVERRRLAGIKLAEGNALRKSQAKEKSMVEAAKQRKLAEMAAHGIPEKYRAELARYRPMT